MTMRQDPAASSRWLVMRVNSNSNQMISHIRVGFFRMLIKKRRDWLIPRNVAAGMHYFGGYIVTRS
jgi:hypothetical protein